MDAAAGRRRRMARMDLTLSPEQIATFHQQGWIALDRIIDADEVAQLREIYDRIFRERIGWEDGAMYDLGGKEDGGPPVLPQIMRPSRYVPELLACSYRRNAAAIARQLYPDTDDNIGDHMIYKPPGYGAPTPWHQDQAYHNAKVFHKGLNFWMPLDDATVENGCLHFVNGSHRLDVLPHHPIGNDPSIVGLEVDEPERWHAQGVAAPVPAGGCTIHAAYCLHYATPNRSERPRRAYILTTHCPTTPRPVPVNDYWNHSKQEPRRERERLKKAVVG